MEFTRCIKCGRRFPAKNKFSLYCYDCYHHIKDEYKKFKRINKEKGEKPRDEL